jgi:hypothetical protein
MGRSGQEYNIVFQGFSCTVRSFRRRTESIRQWIGKSHVFEKHHLSCISHFRKGRNAAFRHAGTVWAMGFDGFGIS